MDKKKLIILGSGSGGGMKTPYAVDLNMSIDSDYILSAHLIDQNGDQIGEEQTIDLPLESMVVSGSYDDTTKSLILELDNGNEITIPVSDLINGLQEEITNDNKLPASLVSGLSTVATTGQYSDLSGTPTIPTVNDSTITLQDGNGTAIDSFTLNQSSNKTITIPSVNDSTITIEQDGVTAGTFTLNQSSNATISLTGGSGGGNQWFGTQTQFDNLSTYDDNTDYFISGKIDYNTDIKNTPDLSSYATKSEVDSKNLEQDNKIASKLGGVFMTQQEYDNLANKQEGVDYWIEGNTVEMVVTFTDQSTATYYVMVD